VRGLIVASFEEIDKARKLLGLGEFASLEEIKQAYRKKAFLYHPDKSGSENAQGEEMMESLNQAYKLLMEYCSRYKYSFKEEGVNRAFPDDAYVRRYVYGWFEGM
jgi:curved DNA-binding protein CbpA